MALRFRKIRKTTARSPHLNVTDRLDPFFISIKASHKVSEAIEIIRQHVKKGVFYIYVVDDREQLAGVISVRHLLLAHHDEEISDHLSPQVISLNENTSLIKAIRIYSQHRFLCLPVINQENKILGVLHADDLVDEYEKERDHLSHQKHREELFDLLGIKAQEKQHSPLQTLKERLPWLIINIWGGCFSAYFIHQTTQSMEQAISLLALVPVLLILTESLGLQTLSLVVSRLKSFRKSRQLFKSLRRESLNSFLLSLVCSVMLGGVAYFLTQSWLLPISISITILIGFQWVTALAHWFPWALHLMKWDPTISAGPVLLAIADVSLVVLLIVITQVLLTLI